MKDDFSLNENFNFKCLFMGSLFGEYELFDYVIQTVDQEKVVVAIPRQASHRYVLKNLDIVDLHLPFYLEGRFYTKGRVQAAYVDAEGNDQNYELLLIQEPQLEYPVYLEIKNGCTTLSARPDISSEYILPILKNSILGNEGIKIYLKHLIPFFSRISGSTESNFIHLRNIVFFNAENKVNENLFNLKKVYKEFQYGNSLENLNLNDLREFYEPGLNLDLLNMAFEEILHIPYVTAVKDLEERLYSNYNSIVLLYSLIKKQVSPIHS